MSSTIENIQTTFSGLNEMFAGRTGDTNYDAGKLVHIHRRNRAFVWSLKMQTDLFDSAIKKYYIPPIICCSIIVQNKERRYVMEGGNRITTIRRILNGLVCVLSLEEKQKFGSHPITLVVMRDIDSKGQREMFRRLNKNTKVTDGQLYAMSEEDSPLVQASVALLDEELHPLRSIITRHFGDTVKKDNDGKKHLENAVALVSGAINGVKHISKSYNVQEQCVEDLTTPIQIQLIVEFLQLAFGVFDIADTIEPLTDMRKKRGQFSVGKWIGAIMYDLHTHRDEVDKIQMKWAKYISQVRQNVLSAEDASKLSGAQNLTATRYKRICAKVEIFLTENRLATDAEMEDIYHQTDDVKEEEHTEEEEE